MPEAETALGAITIVLDRVPAPGLAELLEHVARRAREHGLTVAEQPRVTVSLHLEAGNERAALRGFHGLSAALFQSGLTCTPTTDFTEPLARFFEED